MNPHSSLVLVNREFNMHQTINTYVTSLCQKEKLYGEILMS